MAAAVGNPLHSLNAPLTPGHFIFIKIINYFRCWICIVCEITPTFVAYKNPKNTPAMNAYALKTRFNLGELKGYNRSSINIWYMLRKNDTVLNKEACEFSLKRQGTATFNSEAEKELIFTNWTAAIQTAMPHVTKVMFTEL